MRKANKTDWQTAGSLAAFASQGTVSVLELARRCRQNVRWVNHLRLLCAVTDAFWASCHLHLSICLVACHDGEIALSCTKRQRIVQHVMTNFFAEKGINSRQIRPNQGR